MIWSLVDQVKSFQTLLRFTWRHGKDELLLLAGLPVGVAEVGQRHLDNSLRCSKFKLASSLCTSKYPNLIVQVLTSSCQLLALFLQDASSQTPQNELLD